jgi:hypothetical protein
MLLPAVFLRTLSPAGPAPAGVDDGVVSRELRFRNVPQEDDFWCWAAVAVAVQRFYEPTSSTKQCELVADVLTAQGQLGSGTICCPSASNPACDVLWYVYDALRAVGHYPDRYLEGPPGFGNVKGEIGRGRPVVCRVQWPDGAGHFVAITGYSEGPGVERVTVQDPLPTGIGAEVGMDYDAFVSNYHSAGGRVTHTYWTIPTPDV